MDQQKKYKKKLIDLCQKYGEKKAIVYMRDNDEKTFTSYKQVLSCCECFESLLLSAGIVAGDRVAIISPHSPQAVLTALGLAYSGVTTVLIDASLPMDEINRLLGFADVRGVFTTAKIFEGLDKTVIQRIAIFKLCNQEGVYEAFAGYEKCVEKMSTPDPEEDVIAILFSSGTTAQMKGIKVTYESVMTASEIFIRNVKWKAEYSYLHVFPLNHIAGYATIHAFLFCGCELGMIENMNSAKLLDALLDYEPDGFGMIPKVFEMMEDKIRETIRKKGRMAECLINFLLGLSGFLRKNFGINIGRCSFRFITKKVFGKNIRTIGTGASLCRASTSKFFLDLGLDWANFYASTETNVPAVSTGAFDRYPVLMAGNVKRNPEIDVFINNPDSDGVGEIYIKGKLMMKGYFRDDELTKRSYDGQYFKTGDYGYIDRKNNLYVTGRVKESILLHNGKKISPTDVENYYKSKVADVEIACCGCPKKNASYDETCMFVETAGHDKVHVAEAVTKLRKMSADANQLYKLGYIKLIDKLPLTSVGKVKRFELQKVAMESQEAEIEVKAGLVIDVENSVIGLINKVLGKNEAIHLQTRLKEDLGMDSLSVFELQTEIDMCYGVSMAKEWSKIITVEDLINCIESGKNQRREKSMDLDECYLANRSAKDIRNIKRLVKVLDGICKVEYEGLENLVDEPCILAANHSSHLDVMCVYKAMILKYGYGYVYKMCCLAAKELVEQPGMKKIFHALGAIPVDRKKNAAMSLVTLNKYILDKGYSAVIFPEGTRSRNGKVGKFTHGAAKTAIKAGIPVVPIGITGSYDIWPATRKRPYFSLEKRVVKVSIGKAVFPETSDVNELTEIIRGNILELRKEN